MHEEHREPYATQPWDTLAQVYAASRQVSADQLIEWPAQLKMCGSFQNKHVLDAGCGTGLCGPILRPYAAGLVGVDLSEGMLKVAAEAPLPGQGEIIASPSPEPSASRTSEADAMTKAPAMICK